MIRLRDLISKSTRKIANLGCVWFDQMYQNYTKRQIIATYSDDLLKYKENEYRDLISDSNYPIWVFWWQGIDKMPELVKICYNSLLKNSGDHSVILITQYNYNKYIYELPYLNELLKSLYEKRILHAHFSDIVRHFLLYTYGGCWIDATVLITKDIDTIVGDHIFVSGRRSQHEKEAYINHPAKGLWTSYFVYSNKGNLISKFIYEILTKQLLSKGYMIDYFMMDYCFTIAYEQFDFAKKIQESSPIYPDKISLLMKLLNQVMDEKEFLLIVKDNPFQKLTYKRKWLEYTKENELTYYGYLKKKYL